MERFLRCEAFEQFKKREFKLFNSLQQLPSSNRRQFLMSNAFKSPSITIKLPLPNIQLLPPTKTKTWKSSGPISGSVSNISAVFPNDLQLHLFDKIENENVITVLNQMVILHPSLELYFLRGLYQVIAKKYVKALQGKYLVLFFFTRWGAFDFRFESCW